MKGHALDSVMGSSGGVAANCGHAVISKYYRRVLIVTMWPGPSSSELAFGEVLKRLPDAGNRCASYLHAV